jgi:hypothetical protein
MNNMIRNILVGAALVAATVGCSQGGGGETQARAGQIEALASTGREVVWNTESTVSNTRKIEVGNHPSLKLEAYTMGNREQRVRFFITDQVATQDLIMGSPQDQLFRSDLPLSKAIKYSIFGMVIESPSAIGQEKFSERSQYNGLSVSPQLMVCAAQALAILKQAADTHARAFQNWQLNTTNIYVRPVEHSFQAQSRMYIDVNQKSLNFEIALWTRSGDCFLPNKEEMEQALDIADQRVED